MIAKWIRIFLVSFGLLFTLSSIASAIPLVQDPYYSIGFVASGLDSAHGVAIGPAGDIFVSNYGGNVFRIDQNSYAVSQYATGLSYSLDLTFDNAGKLFVLSGSGDPRDIDQVFPDGSSSLFSTGYSHTVGLEVGPDGYLYLGNTGDGTISKVNSLGESETLLSGLHQPRGLAFDDEGNLYFVESATGDISRRAPDGTVSLVASLGPDHGTFIAVDSFGQIYVSDDPTATIYRIQGDVITAFATGFAGTSNRPALGPLGLEFDSYGNLFVADGDSLWKITPVPVPEPSSILLVVFGLIGLVGFRRYYSDFSG